jgi:hypothetical protein
MIRDRMRSHEGVISAVGGTVVESRGGMWCNVEVGGNADMG